MKMKLQYRLSLITLTEKCLVMENADECQICDAGIMRFPMLVCVVYCTCWLRGGIDLPGLSARRLM